MILDGELMFDPNPTSVAIAAGTQASTNIIDLHMAGIPTLAANQGARDIGIGHYELKILVQTVVAFASAGSTGTIQVAIQGAPDNGSGVPGTYVTMATGPSYVVPIIGTRLMDHDMPRPKDGNLPRFLRLLYTVAVQTMTAGSVASFLVLDRFDQPSQAAGYVGAYPAGLTVSN